MKIEKLNKSYRVKTETDKYLGSFQLDSNGSYYFWVTEELTGCWNSHTLKEIAEKLDEVNDEFARYFVENK